MKREKYDSDKDAAVADKIWWRKVAAGLLISNVLLAMYVAGRDATEKTLLVPPTIEKPFWVKGDDTSAEYLEEMARYLSSLLLNVTPASIDANVAVFLRYVAPQSYGSLKSTLDYQADRVKRSDVATSWYPIEYQTKAKARVVVVTGDYRTTIGKQVVSSGRRSYRFAYSMVGGRLWVSEFVEVGNEHPFEQTVVRDAPAGMSDNRQ